MAAPHPPTPIPSTEPQPVGVHTQKAPTCPRLCQRSCPAHPPAAPALSAPVMNCPLPCAPQKSRREIPPKPRHTLLRGVPFGSEALLGGNGVVVMEAKTLHLDVCVEPHAVLVLA
uniref:Uncharacterized protein n=1 Tax=Zea mays TaxID=4577 RepID=A0A804QUT5_MAIZE